MRTHGRIATYNAGCRCPDCRAANAQRKRDRRYSTCPRLPGDKLCPLCGRWFHPRGLGPHEVLGHRA